MSAHIQSLFNLLTAAGFSFNTRVHCTEIEIYVYIYIYIYVYVYMCIYIHIVSLNYILIIFQLHIKTLDKQKRNNLVFLWSCVMGETRGKMTIYIIHIYMRYYMFLLNCSVLLGSTMSTLIS